MTNTSGPWAHRPRQKAGRNPLKSWAFITLTLVLFLFIVAVAAKAEAPERVNDFGPGMDVCPPPC